LATGSPSAAIHSFLMFAPFAVLKTNMVIQGVALWATGPFLAAYITPSLFEQASIWCFFSIGQIAIMLYVIRDLFILNLCVPPAVQVPACLFAVLF
jgi:ABC-type uncharacterized transport system permease subunit